MSKKLFYSLFLFISNLFAYELEFNKSFSKSIQNDIVQTRVSVVVESSELEYINNKIGLFQNIIKKENKIKITNSDFRQVPVYTYINKEKTFTGYKGTLSYMIESNSYEKIDGFLIKLMREQKKLNSKKVKLSISNTSWSVSKKLYNQYIDQMRIEAISWIHDYSRLLTDNCIVQNIEINNGNRFSPSNYKTSLSVENNTRQITPLQSEKFINLSVSYKLHCK